MAETLELDSDGRQRAAPPGDPLIGHSLLHYRVVEVLGQGGMSVVYRGRDEHLQRDVAIKVLHPFLAEKPECRARLAREARAVARLEHPHIVKVFDFSGDRPTLDEKPGGRRVPGFTEGFIVAELVRGPTLKRFVERHMLWRCPELGAMVVWQVARALAHAHDNGVIHRDLKPENVMVRDDGVLKLMDFGIAQVADQQGLTVTGTLLGSPAHMAPECIEGLPADERSDVFALGTVLYWITTGALPFEALTPHALLKIIVDGRATPAQQKSPRISDELARVIARAMATRPDERYASASALGTALEEVLARAGVGADDEVLRAALADPEAGVLRMSTSVREAYLARAAQLVEDGQPGRAFACLNRVLADNADDVDARALLERAQASDDPATEPPDGHALITASGEGSAAVATITAAEDSRPPSRPPGSSVSTAPTSTLPAQAREASSTSLPPTPARTRVWPAAAMLVAAVSLIGAAVAISRAVDRVATNDATTTTNGVLRAGDASSTDETSHGSPAPPDASSGSARATPTPTERPDAGDEGTHPTSTKRPPIGRIPAGDLRDLRDLRAIREARVPAVRAPGTTTTTAPLAVRTVAFRVTPWADIVVDGAVVARNTMVLQRELAVGPHVVVFQNPRAKDHEVRFVVTADGPAPVVQARLEPRPALLVVNSNVADAYVDVGGLVGKPAQDTAARPLVVALGDASKAELEVFVYKRGYVPYRRNRAFVAGETTRLDVVLEPEGDERAPPGSP